MTNQTVLISGASRGLGAVTARICGQVGANVILMARSENALSQVADDVRREGGQALPIVGDVTQVDDCHRAVTEATQSFGGLDALINNAGMLNPIARIADCDPEALKQNLTVNVLGPFLLCQAALPYLRQSNGRIINVSSSAALNVFPGWAAYCAAKAGVNHFTRVLAEEEPDITSVSFNPGIMDTDMQELIRSQGSMGMTEEDHARFVQYHREGKLLPPEVPGCALAVLAFHAPHDWTGAFLPWNHQDLQSLVRRFACSSGK